MVKKFLGITLPTLQLFDCLSLRGQPAYSETFIIRLPGFSHVF